MVKMIAMIIQTNKTVNKNYMLPVHQRNSLVKHQANVFRKAGFVIMMLIALMGVTKKFAIKKNGIGTLNQL